MLDISLEKLQLVSQICFNIGAGFAGVWAVFQYVKTRRSNAVKWTQQLFEDFYILDHFNDGRNLLEYEYFEKVVPLLRMRVVDRDMSLTIEQRDRLADLDKLLNYFEHLLYLEQSALINKKDRKVFFEYWFGLLSEPDKGSLRRYLKNCGYERLADETLTQEDELVMLSPLFLKSHIGSQLLEDRLIVRQNTKTVKLLSLDNGSFIKSDQDCEYEIFSVTDAANIRKIDEHFSFKRGDENLKNLQRVCMQLGSDKRDIWVHLNYG